MNELLPASIGVQFSGKPAVYHYLIHPEDVIQPGMRVVVPIKLKDDGTLSMSIATCVERHAAAHKDASLPTVQTIHSDSVNHAIERLKVTA